MADGVAGRLPRARVPAVLAAFGLYLATALFSTQPLSTSPAELLPDNADAVGFAWSTAWTSRQLWLDPGEILNANIFHPAPAALAYGEPMVGEALLAWPAWWLSANDALTYNAVLILTLALCALTTYLLVLELTGRVGAAVLAGEIFAFATANFDSAARLQIVSSQWTPLTLLFLVRLFRRGLWRDAAGLGASFAWQGLACNYYQLFLATLLVLVAPLLFLALPRPRHVPWRKLCFAVALAAGVLLPLQIAQLRWLGALASERPLRPGAVPATSYLQTLPENWLYGALLGRTDVSYDDRHFPGFLPPTLAGLGVLAAIPAVRRRLGVTLPADLQPWLIVLAGLGVLAFVLGCGRDLPLPWGDVPGPYRLLHWYVPGYQATRVPSRFAMFVRLVTAVFAAVGLAALLPRLGRRGNWVVAALAVLLPLEHLSTPLPTWKVSAGSRVPPVYHWLAGLGDESGPLVEFPPHPPRFRRWESFWQHYSTVHWLPLVNGFSSYYPVHYEFVYSELLELPSPRGLTILDALGVRYVVFHPKATWFPEGERAVRRFEEEVGSYRGRLELVKSFDDGGVDYPDPVGSLGGERVYRVRHAAPPADPAACAVAGSTLEREGWACQSSEASPCSLAIDGRSDTIFTAAQQPGRFLRVAFPRLLEVSGVSLVTGRWSLEYARAPELWGLGADGWTNLPHRFDAREFLAQMLHCPGRASMDLRFDRTLLSAIEIRVARRRVASGRWLVPELHVYR